VIASVPYRNESLAHPQAGIPVLALAPHSLADIYGDFVSSHPITAGVSRVRWIISAMQAHSKRSGIAPRLPAIALWSIARNGVNADPFSAMVKELVEVAGAGFWAFRAR